MKQPKVSIVMTVYNGERYLKDAVMSVLRQTYQNFEFIVIVEAGITDHTLEILESFTDQRLKIVVNETKLGVSESLNKGLRLAKGKYIARLDADDICCCRRLEKQIQVMEHSPNVGMCGSNVYIIDRNDRIVSLTNNAYKPDALKMLLYTANYFTSSSVMIRREILDKYHIQYSGNVSEDYSLWTQIAEKSDVCNLPEYLAGYRLSEQNKTKGLLKPQESRDLQIHKELWENAGIEYQLDHSFSYRMNGRKTVWVREQMLKELWRSHKFKDMDVEAFYEVMRVFYKTVHLNKRESFWRFLKLTGEFCGFGYQIKCILYGIKQSIYDQRWDRISKMERGRRFEANG